MTISERILVTLVLLLVGGVCCLLAASLTRGAGLLPLAAGVPVVIGCAVQLVRDVRRGSGETESNTAGRAAVVSALIFLGLLYLLGFLTALPLYAGFTWKRSGAGWPAAATLAGGLLAVLLVGSRALNVELYEGVLWGWLR
jgi:hypothetical protein